MRLYATCKVKFGDVTEIFDTPYLDCENKEEFVMSREVTSLVALLGALGADTVDIHVKPFNASADTIPESAMVH